MGANIINMGVIGGFVGYYTFHGLMLITKNLSLSAFPQHGSRVSYRERPAPWRCTLPGHSRSAKD